VTHQAPHTTPLTGLAAAFSTQGDSFILAFHEPKSAVQFATQLQLALVEASWPPQLEQLAACKPVISPVA